MHTRQGPFGSRDSNLSAGVPPGPVKVTRPAPVKVTVGAFGDNLTTIERKEVGVCMPQCLALASSRGYTKVLLFHTRHFSHETRVKLGRAWGQVLFAVLICWTQEVLRDSEMLSLGQLEGMNVGGAYPDYLAYVDMGLVKCGGNSE